MKLDLYLKSWKGSLQENKFSRYITLTLVVTNLVLVMLVMGGDRTVVLVPEGLSQEAEISSKHTSASYKEVWATHVAMLLGNVTPRTAPFVTKEVGKLMGPGVYRQMMEGLVEQADRIANEQLTVQFAPSQTFYLTEKDVVVVSGEYTVRGMRDVEERMIRTYEIGLDVSNYVVRVDSLEVYEGAWSPQREESKKVEERKARRSKSVAKEG